MTKLITYTVELALDRGVATPAEWRVKGTRTRGPGFGRPNAENLEAYCRLFELSTLPGGCNERLGRLEVRGARIVRQADRTVVATARAA